MIFEQLENIAEIYNGNSINKDVKSKKYTGLKKGYDFIATKDVSFDGKINYNNGVKIPFEEKGFKIAPSGCVFVCAEGGSAGRKTAIIDRDVCFGNKLYAIKCKTEKVVSQYVYFFTLYRDFYKQFKNLQNGIIGGVTRKNFGKIEIPLPPLPEQQRIVAKIEELFAELDNSVAMLKKVKEQINQYNESVMEQIFQQSDCSWEEYKLGDEKICSINKNFDLPDFEDEEIVSFLPMAVVEAKTNKFYPQTTTYRKVKKGYTKFRNGDILFAKITPCMENGKICIVNDLIKDCGFGSTEFHVLRCSENLLPKFLYYFISREHFLRRAVPYMTGSVGQKRMPADYLAEQKIKVPSINVQKQIINDVENKISKSKSIDNILDSVLVNCDALRQSILKKAFEGEL